MRVLMGLVELVKALEKGRGIQYLLDSAYEIFKNPISVVDVNYTLLAYTDTPFDDAQWNELTTIGTFSKERLERLANAGLIEAVVNADKVAILRDDLLPHARATGLIYTRNAVNAGLVMMSEDKTAFDEECIAAFKVLTDKITCEIRDYDYFTFLAMAFHEEKMNLLLDKAVTNPLLYTPQAQILYNHFEDYLFVAVVCAARNGMQEHVYRNKLAFTKSMLQTCYPSFKISIYSDTIVMLMSSKYKYFYGERFFDLHADLFAQNSLTMGISGSFENIYDLRVYYDQALAALTQGLRTHNDQRIFLYNHDR